MAPKKNRVSVFGKTFHLTPGGKILPLGSKHNWFTNCMSNQLKGRQNTGENLSASALAQNKNNFGSTVAGCTGVRGGGLLTRREREG